jgi:DNA-binding MarR family transcriptional regulator
LLVPLERRGIVSREVCGHDARATFAVLTRSGKALVEDATTTMNSVAQSILGSLDARDAAAFLKLHSL